MKKSKIILCGLLASVVLVTGCGQTAESNADSSASAVSDTATAESENVVVESTADTEEENEKASDENETVVAGSEESDASEDVSSESTENAGDATETEADKSDQTDAETTEAALPDGQYEVDVDTHNTMFRVNDAKNGKGILTVQDGVMTVHISLVSKNIVNLYPGTAEDAADDEDAWLQPTTDEIDYGDGTDPSEVYGFDIPVPALDEEFDVAILGKKGKWYDHTVTVSNAVALEE